eukprot:349641-Chlamydomonas_euryale.AAC.14
MSSQCLRLGRSALVYWFDCVLLPLYSTAHRCTSFAGIPVAATARLGTWWCGKVHGMSECGIRLFEPCTSCLGARPGASLLFLCKCGPQEPLVSKSS